MSIVSPPYTSYEEHNTRFSLRKRFKIAASSLLHFKETKHTTILSSDVPYSDPHQKHHDDLKRSISAPIVTTEIFTEDLRKDPIELALSLPPVTMDTDWFKLCERQRRELDQRRRTCMKCHNVFITRKEIVAHVMSGKCRQQTQPPVHQPVFPTPDHQQPVRQHPVPPPIPAPVQHTVLYPVKQSAYQQPIQSPVKQSAYQQPQPPVQKTVQQPVQHSIRNSLDKVEEDVFSDDETLINEPPEDSRESKTSSSMTLVDDSNIFDYYKSDEEEGEDEEEDDVNSIFSFYCRGLAYDGSMRSNSISSADSYYAPGNILDNILSHDSSDHDHRRSPHGFRRHRDSLELKSGCSPKFGATSTADDYVRHEFGECLGRHSHVARD